MAEKIHDTYNKHCSSQKIVQLFYVQVVSIGAVLGFYAFSYGGVCFLQGMSTLSSPTLKVNAAFTPLYKIDYLSQMVHLKRKTTI